ncbi:peptidase [Massarina eburnea CBS 473.64]|uniref:Peptide hydrolase n=1 Tax=Massarina eburnea CBS 473.64 TaxID=1395130 RepID=A0A6A6S275_9PLEO|nr:peptidase [Massarina eburnea CBS 473.64]
MKVSSAIGAFLAVASAAVVDRKARGDGHGHDHLPMVDSRKLQNAIKSKALLGGAKVLEKIAFSTPGRNRQMGTLGHNLTTDFLVKELKKLGGYYKVETQTFWAPTFLNGTGTLLIDGVKTDSGMFDYTTTGNVTAPIVVVNNLGCTSSDYPSTLSGNIALVKRGSCEFGLKSALAGAAGAKGALIYNNIQGRLEGTLGLPGRPEGEYLPTLGLSNTQGLDFVTQITGGATVTATIDVASDIQNRSTVNILATTTHGNSDEVLVLGAHTDSVYRGPGINDDGSGTIGILEVAKALSKYKVNNAVRFGWWSGEEIGLLGSEFYVASLSAEEQAKIRLYLNFDMIASPNYILGIYDGDGSAYNNTGPAGSAQLEHFYQNWFKSNGHNYTSVDFTGRSDYGPFLDINVPCGGTETGAEVIKTEAEVAMFGGTAGIPYDPNYHQAGDGVGNLAMDAFEINAKAIAASVAEYAVSYKSLPPKAKSNKRGVFPRRTGKGKTLRI